MLKQLIIVATFFAISACNESKFHPIGNSATSSEQSTPMTSPEPEQSPSEPVVVISSSPVPNALSTCWVAISGTIFGRTKIDQDDLTSAYPFRGNLPPHIVNDSDVVLMVREKEYKYHDEGQEIDPAISGTFDSMLVAPGVKVTLTREDGSKTEVVGPSLKMSNDEPFPARYYQPERMMKFYLSKPDLIPTWLNELLKVQALPSEMPLVNVRSILVEKTANASCD